MRSAVVRFVASLFLTAPSICAGAFWDDTRPLAPAEVFVLTPDGTRRDAVDAARRERLLEVDLSDEWAPFIFSESDGLGAPT